MILIDGGPEGTIITSHVPKQKVLPKPPTDLGLLTYSARAERLHHILNFFSELLDLDAQLFEIQIRDEYLTGHDNKQHLIPDKTLQFSSNLPLDYLRNIAETSFCSDAIAQTLRQCTIEENSMERRSVL